MESTKNNYTREEHAIAKMKNIFTYLNEAGYELVKTKDGYRSKLHKSLVIKPTGLWYWNSLEVGGRSPIELLKRILMTDYNYTNEKIAIVEAVKRLAGTSNNNFKGVIPRVNPNIIKPETNETDAFILPKKDIYTSKVIDYLCKNRGLDEEIIKNLIKEKKIYQAKEYYNVVFVGYDKENNPRNATIRGIYDDKRKFVKQVEFSDKSYPFTISGYENATTVCCFETAINALSHATIYKINNYDYKNLHRISLDGLAFQGLDRFLSENPQVKKIVACFNNDSVGNKRNIRAMFDYEMKGYTVVNNVPKGVDFNVDLMNYRSEIEEGEQEM